MPSLNDRSKLKGCSKWMQSSVGPKPPQSQLKQNSHDTVPLRAQCYRQILIAKFVLFTIACVLVLYMYINNRIANVANNNDY